LARVLLISTYDMGRQPFGLASPAAWLARAGWTVDCADVSRDPLGDDLLRQASVVAFYLPMHTATRLALPLVARARRVQPAARIAAYGVYAPLNDAVLREAGVDRVFGGEFEEALVEWAAGGGPREADAALIPRLRFIQPDRHQLPPLARYAAVVWPDGTRRQAGYTEASRGCRHLCRHCPIVPVYEGQFRIVQPEVVLADIDAQVAAGAGHITFGDPDFFNGPTHAIRIVEAMHERHPALSFDVTIKIEHLLRHRALLPRLAASGCAFVTSAVESIDDEVLAILDKGHTRDGFVSAVALCRDTGLTLVPTLVAFHPWTTLAGYCELLDTIEALGLVDRVAPIQLAIRLLVPQGSRLLGHVARAAAVERFDPATLTYRWIHRDPRVDALQEEVSRMVGLRAAADRRALFAAISDLAHERAGLVRPRTAAVRDRATVPYLNEPWYC
jgi:radical SAM superfamily enzyme YgiQ (UPF0313 family)